jgi:hypothetical protein
MLIVLLVDDSARNTLSWPRGCPYAQGFDQLTQLQTPATVVIQILRPFMYYTHFSDHGLKLFFALVYEIISPMLERLLTADIKVKVNVDDGVSLDLTRNDLNVDFFIQLVERRNAWLSALSALSAAYDEERVS